jgi:transcriptional regulator
MYVPKHFDEGHPDHLHALIVAHPLASLVTRASDGQIEINHLPFMTDGGAGTGNILRGHVARTNPMWAHLDEPVALVFQGPEGYVSPSWYATKAINPRVVPTWNYAVVHVTGHARAIESQAWLTDLIRSLTDHHERDRDPIWSVDDAPEDFIARLTEQIVGIEVTIDSIVGKFKLSQNRSLEDQQGVIDGLNAAGTSPLADLMERYL